MTPETNERRPVNRWQTSLLIVFVALGLAAAGCGGDDDDEAGGGTVATTEAETQADTTGGGATLNGSVGPGFDISIEGAEGLSPGSYTLVVNDQSSSHNFHLTGPGGIDVATDVDAEGEESFDVELESGEYTFVCDPHASQMRGTFTVG
jgi:plastocyanin